VAFDVLRHPTVASKRFLITIGDRTVGGLSHRDPMVGPWQVPVADCAVTLADYAGLPRGEAMSMGERTPLAALDAPASGRMAVGEAITNLLAAPIELSRVKLSANWMAACGEPGEDAALYDTVRAVGLELCPALGIGIPVGKDSCRCARAGRTTATRQVTAPVSADRHRLRHAGRRARHAHAAAAAGRHHADAGRPGPGPHAHGRLDAGAGAGPVRRRVPDLDDPQDLLKALVAP
jgi:phosphoribosylformylglycinamidine synthase